MKNRIAYFISPHGYGHAARASGLMSALSRFDGGIKFEIFTTVPEWFFSESIPAEFGYHPLLTDIGLVQESPFRADLDETIRQLDHFLPFMSSIIHDLADTITGMKCNLIICDIAPIGIAVAGRAGIPSVLVENFTWDWLYEEYKGLDGRITRHIEYLKTQFDRADYHIQAQPICLVSKANLTTRPISRRVRTPAGIIRKRLGVPEDTKMILITMGGIQGSYPFLKSLRETHDIFFIIPGLFPEQEVRGNLLLLPYHSEFYHPDLLNASDAVIGKAGYSTLAEVYYSGVPFGYIARENFRESRILVSYIEKEMKGLAIKETDFYRGDWISRLPDLLALPWIQRIGPDGAEQAARFIYGLLNPGSVPPPAGAQEYHSSA